jgi:hypothetical protein
MHSDSCGTIGLRCNCVFSCLRRFFINNRLLGVYGLEIVKIALKNIEKEAAEACFFKTIVDRFDRF